MEYLVKSYRLGEDVVAWLDGLKAVHGSVNKGLRAAMQSAAETMPPTLRPSGKRVHRSADLDEYLETEREKNHAPPQQTTSAFKGPLLKPGAKKDK